MVKHFRVNRLVIMIAVIAVLLAATGSIIFAMSQNYVNIKGQHLKEYRFGSGGGMTGGYYVQSVLKHGDDKALVSIEKAGWHYEDPKVTEWLVDAAILSELEDIVRKHKMNHWHHKKFTNRFIADGETDGYHFYFDEDEISFSSQIFPKKYSTKLDELDDVITKYLTGAEELPKLVVEKDADHYGLPEGYVVVYASSYVRNYLTIKVLNGTDEIIRWPRSYQVINTDTGEVVQEGETPYGNSFYQRSQDSTGISLKKRLSKGSYKAVFGEVEVPFEIR